MTTTSKMTTTNNSLKNYLQAFSILLLFILTISFSAQASSSLSSETSKMSALEDKADEVQVGLYLDKACDFGSFEFMNGRASSSELIIDEPNEKFYRIQVNMNSPVDLKQYPFDQQRMDIILENKDKTIEQLKYIPLKAETGVDSDIAFTGWNIEGWKASSKKHEYSIYGESYSQYVFSLYISRLPLSSFFKTFLPIFFIVLLVLFSFILDPDKITTRLGMNGSSLVAAVMFHVSISNQLPPVGYLTFADKVMILTYFVLLISFIINILLLELQENKKTELVNKIHHYTEYSMFAIVPVIYVLFFMYFI
ncbi:hypothetical protein HYU21_00655 [Candidatus Woesearchaeota archaeon]|nr:hypothetical protein [Candidatus Woesearchaeota archaeon]